MCELITAEGFAYGYLKLTHCLRRKFHLIINKKKVYRLCKELDILRPQRKIKHKHPRRLARNRVITASNQLWETDIKSGYIAGEDRFFFVMPIIDVFDRCSVAYHIGLSCEAKDAVITLKNRSFGQMRFTISRKKRSIGGSLPIIIDQPEADLDNRYIYEMVVKLLRQRKFLRQIIVATHNANIPVNGDAELIVALGVEKRMGNVLGAGSIDQPEIKDLVTTIMEGSAEAFRLRRERYGF